MYHNLIINQRMGAKGNWWRVALIATVTVLLFFWPFLLGGQLILGDSWDATIPLFAFYKRAITEEGINVFWNHYSGAGFPTVGSASQIFNPFSQILIRILDPIATLHWLLFFYLIVALFFAIQFFRELQVGIWSAWVGGVAYLISGLVLGENVVTASALAILPMLFLMILKVAQTKRLAFFYVGGILVVALAWITTFQQIVLYTLVAAFLFIAFLSYKQKSWRTLIYAIIVGIVGTMLATIQLWPMYLVAQLSSRANMSYQEAAVGTISFKELLRFINPIVAPRTSEAYLYMGLIPLVFLAYSFLIKRNFYVWFFRGLFFISLLIAIEKSPLFWLVYHLPLFNLFRVPARFMWIGSFGGAALVALGAHEFLSRISSIRFWQKFGRITLMGATSIVTIELILNTSSFFDSMPRSIVEKPPGAAAFLQQHPGRVFPLFVDELFTESYYAITGKTPPKNKETTIRYQKETLYPNHNLFYGLENLEIYEPLINPYLAKYIALLGGRNSSFNVSPETELRNRNIQVTEKMRIFQQLKSLPDFLGVRYFLSGFALSQSNLGIQIDAKPVFSTSIQLKGLATSTDIGIVEELKLVLILYRNDEARPLVYFTPITGFGKDREDVSQKFQDSGFRGIFVECSDCDKQTVGRGEAEILISEAFTKGKITNAVNFNTVSSSDQFLVFSQAHYPGWRAFIDGREIPIYEVNGVFMGIFVPPGEHMARFEYDYWSLFHPKFIFGSL